MVSDTAIGIDSVDMDGRNEAMDMENDVGEADAPSGDAVPHSGDEVMVNSEGADASISTDSGRENLEENITPPEIDIGDRKSEDYDDSVYAKAEVGNPPINEIDDDDEEVVIVPNFVDDPIILHVHSKQAKPKPKDNALADDILSRQLIEVSDTLMPQQVTVSTDLVSNDSTNSIVVGMHDVAAYDNERNLNGSVNVIESTMYATNESTVEDPAPASPDNSTKSADSKVAEVSGDEVVVEQKQIKLVDYASKLAGAQILENSSSFKGASNLLTGDKDKYSIAPCEDKKYIVIGLSEDILVKKIKLSNYERYSSRVKKFEVLASQEYPTPTEEHWNSIGTYEAHSKSGEQVFELENPTWARYLQFRFLSHYGSEHYCTLSQIKVHGSTMLQGFHEQWVESEKKELELEQVDDTVEVGEEFVGDDEVVKSDDKYERSQDATKENAPDGEVAGNIMAEVDTIDGQPTGSDAQVRQVGDSLAATQMNQQVETKDEVISEQRPIEEEPGTKGSNVSPHEPTTDEIMSSESNDVEAAIIPETVQSSNEYPPETKSVRLHATGDVKGSDTSYPGERERIVKELNESHATGAISDDDSVPTTTGNQPHDILSETVKDSIDHNVSQTGDEDERHERTDSSIIAVKDVVKTVVADASDVIKNATRETMKNVKDALLTSVTSTKIGNSALDNINATTQADLGDLGDEVDLTDRKLQQAPTTIDENETYSSAQDTVKSKAEEASIKDLVAEDSTPEKGSTISKIDSKAKAGRDLPQRAIVPGKETEVTKLYAMLSRRFPNAKCLKDLDFQTFKAKTMLAGAGGSLGGVKMEPIFTKITSEIKLLHNSMQLNEQYASALKACYEAVLWDVTNEIDSIQSSVGDMLLRLDRAEQEQHSRSNSVSNLFSTVPVALQPGSAFDMPVQSKVFWAFTLAIFLFLVRSFSRRRTVRDRKEKNVVDVIDVGSGDGSQDAALKNGERVIAKPATTEIPELVSDNDLLAKELDTAKARLTEKDEKLACLQMQHSSLQKRYSQLEQTISALESKIEQLTPAKDMMRANRNGYTTPPPTAHSEPLSEIMTISPTDDIVLKEQERIENCRTENN